MADFNPFVLRRMLALKQFPIFAGAELGELAMLADNVAEATFPAGALIAPPGARPSAIQLVLGGQIAMRGSRTETWGPHEMFATLEVLARRALAEPAIATVETKTLQLFASDVTEVLDENIGVLLAVLRTLAARLARSQRTEHPQRLHMATRPLGFVDRLNVLRRQPLFASARLEVLATLAHASEEIEVAKGDALVRAGELAAACYVIVDGDTRNEGGRSVGSGASVGMLETLGDLTHGSTIEAIAPTRALKTSATTLFDVIEDHTEFGLAMIRAFSNSLLDLQTGDGTN